MKPYLDLLRNVLDYGEVRTDRTGVGTISCFGAQTRYDLREGFPLVTTKRVNFDSVVKELLWFLRGETNTKTLGCGIWDAWADERGELGPIYGKQWRSWGYDFNIGTGTDQIAETLERIKTDPMSRRHIVSAWNLDEIPEMALPPCHVMFQFYVSTDGYLDLQLYQRSADLALGVPFNIASYALLLSMFANECKLRPRYFIHTIGDAHIYLNHVEGVREQLSRTPKLKPSLMLDRRPVLEMTLSDIRLDYYDPHPAIRFYIAV